MSPYTQPIIQRGLIGPAVINLVILMLALYGISEVGAIRAKKTDLYEKQVLRTQANKKLEEANLPKRKTFEDQKKILRTDPGLIYTKVLDRPLTKYKEIELDRSSLVFPIDRGSIGRNVKCDLVRVKSVYSGGLGPMQEILLQVESLMPQSVLEEMRISRKPSLLLNHQETLMLDTTHTCWKAEEAVR